MDGTNQSGHEAGGTPLAMIESGDTKKLQRQRHNYVSLRLAEITERIREFAAEREQITSNLKTRQDEKGDDVRKLRQRREYLATRLGHLREEQHTLNLEKKTLAPHPTPTPTARKPGKAKAATAGKA